MKRKILMAGFLSTIIVTVAFASFAASVDLKPETDTAATNGNLITTLETVLTESDDITLDELFEADQLIQEQIMQKIVQEYELLAEGYQVPLDPGYCQLLLNFIQNCREQANIWRDKATWRPDDHIWVTLCNMIANWYDSRADSAEALYNALGCG